MNTTPVKDMIKVMEAYSNGSTIECRVRGSSISKWEECENPIWNWPYKEYRIKVPKVYKEVRMTQRQLSQLLSWGYGELKFVESNYSDTRFVYDENEADEPVDKSAVIRPWSSTEWREPFKYIYDDYMKRCGKMYNVLKDSEEIIDTLSGKNRKGQFTNK